MCTPSGSQSRLLPSGRGWGGGQLRGHVFSQPALEQAGSWPAGASQAWDRPRLSPPHGAPLRRVRTTPTCRLCRPAAPPLQQAGRLGKWPFPSPPARWHGHLRSLLLGSYGHTTPAKLRGWFLMTVPSGQGTNKHCPHRRRFVRFSLHQMRPVRGEEELPAGSISCGWFLF